MGNVPFVQLGGWTGGINNIAPVRSLAPNEVREAVGVDFDNIGNAGTHPGLTTTVSGAAHSLWANHAGAISLFVKGTSLYSNISNPVVIDTVASGKYLSYDEINNEIYYSNGVVLKKTDGQSVSTVTNPDDRPYKTPMKPGDIIAFYNKRLYAVLGGVIFFSDPMSYGTRDELFCRLPLPGSVKMFKPVNDGIWVSFGGKTYFMLGQDPATTKFNLIEKLDYAALGQAVEIRKELGGLEVGGDKIIGWLSEKGVCFGTDSGLVINRSSGRYKVLSGMRSAACLFRVKNDGIGHLISAAHN